MTINFTDALNKKVGDLERPPLVPIGLYLTTVQKVPTMDTIAQDRFDVVDFPLVVAAPVEVDEDELKDFRDSTGGDVIGQPVRLRFMFNKEDEVAFKRALFNLRRFLEEHLKCASSDVELKVALNNSVNGQCHTQIGHRPDPNDSEVQYIDVRRTLPVE